MIDGNQASLHLLQTVPGASHLNRATHESFFQVLRALGSVCGVTVSLPPSNPQRASVLVIRRPGLHCGRPACRKPWSSLARKVTGQPSLSSPELENNGRGCFGTTITGSSPGGTEPLRLTWPRAPFAVIASLLDAFSGPFPSPLHSSFTPAP